MYRIAIAALLASVLSANPVLAQDQLAAPAAAQLTQEQVRAACADTGATEANCKAMLAAYFAQLQAAGIADIALEQAIADLVAALAGSPGATGEAQAVIIAAIREIGTTYATGEQAVVILAAAETVGVDPTVTGSIIPPIPASPA
jgi:hypothetical protein